MVFKLSANLSFGFFWVLCHVSVSWPRVLSVHVDFRRVWIKSNLNSHQAARDNTKHTEYRTHTVDGSEIGRSPVDMVNITLFTGFYTSQVVSRISSINSPTATATTSSSFLPPVLDVPIKHIPKKLLHCKTSRSES